MAYHYLNQAAIDLFIKQALAEDIGPGDYSTLASVPAGATKQARLLLKSEGILAGVELARQIFAHFDPDLKFTELMPDGSAYKQGQEAFHVEGSGQTILSCERLVLNCMQRMCAIATKTHQMSLQLVGTKAKLLDTRKTTPNFRLPEKWAVKIGGGTNHRFALYDMVMLKDNHIDYAGGIKPALALTKAYLETNHLDLEIEIEIRTKAELEEALEMGIAQRILLDNMMPSLVAECVQMVAGRAITEASGGIAENTLRDYALTGVDFISAGALTHSAGSLDMSLKAM